MAKNTKICVTHVRYCTRMTFDLSWAEYILFSLYMVIQCSTQGVVDNHIQYQGGHTFEYSTPWWGNMLPLGYGLITYKYIFIFYFTMVYMVLLGNGLTYMNVY